MTARPKRVRAVHVPDRRPTVLSLAATWAIAVPWLASAAGLDLDVSTRLEVIDHVLPGILALVCAASLTRSAGRSSRELLDLAAAAVAFLAGLWITTTHGSLLGDAGSEAVPWGAAVLHLSAGPPVIALGGWLLLRPPRPDPRGANQRGPGAA